jgi:enamine deaminase RidA (YjgF/YER057c/UK114 family)
MSRSTVRVETSNSRASVAADNRPRWRSSSTSETSRSALGLGYHQGELVSGHTRTLYCAGQAAMSADGTPEHPGDLAAQLALSLGNLRAVLDGGGMSLADLVRLTVYTTDVDRLLAHYGVLAAALGAAGVAPATTVLGVSRLAVPGLLVELEGTAVA